MLELFSFFFPLPYPTLFFFPKKGKKIKPLRRKVLEKYGFIISAIIKRHRLIPNILIVQYFWFVIFLFFDSIDVNSFCPGQRQYVRDEAN